MSFSFAPVHLLARFTLLFLILVAGAQTVTAQDTVELVPTGRSQAFESDPVGGYAEFEVRRSGNQGNLKVNFQITGSATPSTDYTLFFTKSDLTVVEVPISAATDSTTGLPVNVASVTIPASQSSFFIRVVPLPDDNQLPPEQGELVTLRIVAGDAFQDYVIGGRQSDTITIIDANIVATMKVINGVMKETLTLDKSNGSGQTFVDSRSGVIRVAFPNSTANEGDLSTARGTTVIAGGSVVTGIYGVTVAGYNYFGRAGDPVTFIGECTTPATGRIAVVSPTNGVASIEVLTGGAGYIAAPTFLVPHTRMDSFSPFATRNVALKLSSDSAVEGQDFKAFYTIGGSQMVPETWVPESGGSAFHDFAYRIQTEYLQNGTTVAESYQTYGVNLSGGSPRYIAGTEAGTGSVAVVNGIRFLQVNADPAFPAGAQNKRMAINDDGFSQASIMLVANNGTYMTVASLGVLKEFTVVNGGSYVTVPNVTIVSADGNGAGATATASLNAAGKVNRITLNTAGTGYTAFPVVQIADPVAATAAFDIDIATGQITSVTPAVVGEGYTVVPNVTITDSSGVGNNAVVTAVVTNGQVTSYTITNAGTGYTDKTKITVKVDPPPSSSTATATVTMTSTTGFTNDIRQGKGVNFFYDDKAYQTVTAIDVNTNQGGGGYTKPPVVSIQNNTRGRGAAAQAVLTDGVVTGITVTNGGMNYNGVPTVVIDPPIKTQATATADYSGSQITVTMDEGKNGAGYVAKGTTVTITDNTGFVVGEKITVTVTNGSVQSITVAASGTAYTLVKPLKVTISKPNGTTAQATAKVDLTSNNIKITGTINEPVMYPKGATSMVMRQVEHNIHPSNTAVKSQFPVFHVGDVFWLENDPKTLYRVTGPTPAVVETHPSGQGRVNNKFTYPATTSWAGVQVADSEGFITFTPPLAADLLRTDALFIGGQGMALQTEFSPSFAAQANQLAITIPALPTKPAPIYPDPVGTLNKMPNGDWIDFVFTPIQDTLVEGAETITLSLLTSNVNTGYTVRNPATATVTISDDDATARVDLVRNAGKPSYSGFFQVTLTKSFPTDITIPYTLSTNGISAPANWVDGFPISGGATKDFGIFGTAEKDRLDVTDPTRPSGYVTLKAGQTTAQVEVRPIDNLDPTDNEQVRLVLLDSRDYILATTGSSDVNASAATMNIARSAGTVTVSAPTALVSENTQFLSTTAGVFRLSLARAVGSTGPIQVSYVISGSAASGIDFLALSGSAIIPAGTGPISTLDIPVIPLDDGLVEPNESVILTVQPGPGYKVGVPNSDSVTIQDDEPVVSVVLASDAQEPGSKTGLPGMVGKVTFSYPAIATGNAANPLQFLPRDLDVLYAVTGSAGAGTDYATLSGTIRIPAQTNTATLNITPLFDELIESSEEVIITLLPSLTNTYTVSTTTSSAKVTIMADLVPVVYLDNSVLGKQNGREPGGIGNDGFFTVGYSISGSAAPLARDIVVGYTVDSTSTATSGSDYLALPGTVTIPAGSFTAKIPVSILDDATPEVTETLLLNLASRSGYVLSTDSTMTRSSIQILDNEPSVVAFTVASQSVEEGKTASLQVRRTGGTSSSVSVLFSTVNGTATAGSDFAGVSGKLSWASGDDATKTITIPIIADGINEVGESFSCSLFVDAASPSPVSLGVNSTQVISIPINSAGPVEEDPNARDVGDNSKSGCGSGSGIAALLSIAGWIALSMRRRSARS